MATKTNIDLPPRKQRLLELYKTSNFQQRKVMRFYQANGGDLKQAVIDAGYSLKSIDKTVNKFKNSPMMQEFLSLLAEELLERLISDKTPTVEEIKALALSNMKDYLDPVTNRFIGMAKLTRKQAAAIAEVNYDKDTGELTKFKLYDKRLSLHLLAQVQQLLNVEEEQTDDSQVMDRIRKAQQRIKPPAHLAESKLKLSKTG